MILNIDGFQIHYYFKQLKVDCFDFINLFLDYLHYFGFLFFQEI